jgi:hypothetical protein
MNSPELFVFAFLIGLASSGLAGSLIEWRTHRPASFSPPLFMAERPLRSVALSTVAGPWMLVNDAIAARNNRSIGGFMYYSCFLTAGLWMLATGIVLLDLASRLI